MDSSFSLRFLEGSLIRYFLYFTFVFQSVCLASSVPVSDVLATVTAADRVLGREDFNYSDYYQIKDFIEGSTVNLLNLEHVRQKFPQPSVPYNRRAQFGTWIDPTHDDSCLNTRDLVLARDSESNVTYKPSGCSVQEGVWEDPYSATTFQSPTELHIDHFVPLKNAYMTGAHSWSAKKRCLYTNYMGNNFHLIAVSSRENMSKGDGSPFKYIPKNEKYVCQYIKQWLQVKIIWSLLLTPKEVDAIQKVSEAHKCNPKQFKMSATDLAAQRRYMYENENYCSHLAN